MPLQQPPPGWQNPDLWNAIQAASAGKFVVFKKTSATTGTVTVSPGRTHIIGDYPPSSPSPVSGAIALSLGYSGGFEEVDDTVAAMSVGSYYLLLGSYIEGLEDALASVSVDQQMGNQALQLLLQKQASAIQLLSNTSKRVQQSLAVLIRKLGG